MKIQPECVPCLLKRVIFESELHEHDGSRKVEVIKKACVLIGQLYNPSACSAAVATKVHKIVYDLLDDSDPYLELKQTSNEVAQSLIPLVCGIIDSTDDRVKAATMCAIIGNVLDFGIAGGSEDPKSLTDNFQRLYTEGLGWDDYHLVQPLLKSSKNVVLFTDNCGEIVFDAVLCDELKRAYPSCHLTVVVRGEPIISDATMVDAKEAGVDKYADIVLTTGCFAIGVDFTRLPPRVSDALDAADLIICKGMANYESFSETVYVPIVYLLRSKCTAIARSMQVPLDASIIKLYT
ncbi:MAG: DUF89 family protein [Candidatus Thermoplasmatota archaeon]|nr:DUF89 family protein [Candidatus Thermoplasmatota archaeon]MBU1940596.1 DUF89 family protein [Candidatus Thermoplasmatota archaeon]